MSKTPVKKATPKKAAAGKAAAPQRKPAAKAAKPSSKPADQAGVQGCSEAGARQGAIQTHCEDGGQASSKADREDDSETLSEYSPQIDRQATCQVRRQSLGQAV